MSDLIYPKNLMPVAGSVQSANEAFEIQCEALLLNYGFQTARAYLCDLEAFRDWCDNQEPVVSPLMPRALDIQAFVDELIHLGYSPNTVARRLTALRVFLDINFSGRKNPARAVLVVRRRKSTSSKSNQEPSVGAPPPNKDHA